MNTFKFLIPMILLAAPAANAAAPQSCSVTRYGSICSDGNGNYCEHHYAGGDDDDVVCYGPNYPRGQEDDAQSFN